MATVTAPVREETDWERPQRPRLVLEDYTQPRPAPRTRRKIQRRWENILFATAVAAVLLFALASGALSLYRSAAASYASPLASAAVLPVTVHPGDSLWTYAQKYGASDVYILDRVEAIARANHLSSDAALVPGQHLLIPVTDPAKIAQLEKAHRLAQRQ